MKTLALTLSLVGLPGMAWAHGDHTAAGEAHLLAHFLTFGILVAIAGLGALLLKRKFERPS